MWGSSSQGGGVQRVWSSELCVLGGGVELGVLGRRCKVGGCSGFRSGRGVGFGLVV